MILVKYTPQSSFQGTSGYFFSTDEEWLKIKIEAEKHFEAGGNPPTYDQDQEVYFGTWANWRSCYSYTRVDTEDAELIIKLLGPRMGSTFTHF